MADVAARLRLSVRQIEAIEAEDYASLPGKAFIRGFLRNYAKLLKLDQDSVLSAASVAGALDGGAALIRAPDQNIRFTSSEAVSNRKLFLWTLAILAVAGLTAATWRWGASLGDIAQRAKTGLSSPLPVVASGESPQPTPAASADAALSRVAATATDAKPASAERAAAAPPPGPAVAREEAVVAAPTGTTAAAPSAAAASGQDAPVAAGANRLKMSFAGESWVEMRDASGRKIYAKLNAPGSTEQIDVAPPVSLIIGNARDVKLSFNGQDIDLAPHIRVSVARLTLDN